MKYVAIKGMEMPFCCEGCDFRKSDSYSGEVYCSKAIGSDTIIYEKERLENCPLVEIVTCKDCKCECTWKNGEKFSETRPNFYCADVVERERIDKAIEEIEQTLYVDSLIFGELIDFKDGKISADDVIEEFNRVTRKEVLEIIKRNVGESK